MWSSLLAKGHEVWATVHQESELAPLRAALAPFGERAHVVKLDITQPADRARATAWDLDVLVNKRQSATPDR